MSAPASPPAPPAPAPGPAARRPAWLLPALGWGGALLALLLVGGVGSPFLVSIALSIMLHAIFALGLNVVVGYTGLLDLGYASFIAIGAFVVSLGLVLTHQPPRDLPALPVRQLVLTQAQRELAPRAGVPLVVRERPDLRYDVVAGAEAVLDALARDVRALDAEHVRGLTFPVGQATARGSLPFAFPGGLFVLLALAGAAGAAAGVLRGFPTLRLTGDYYAIVTLGFAEIVWLVTLNEDWLTGGAFGIKLSERFRPRLLGDALYDDTWQFYGVVLAALVAAVVASWRLERSRVGRAWAAIRADETAARSSGIDVDRYKLLAFAVSGAIGAVGGGLFALKVGTIVATKFDIWLSIVVVCCLVLGGMGTIRGAVAGAALLIGLGEVLRLLSDTTTLGAWALPAEARFLVYGLVLVVVMRFRPQGLLARLGGGGLDAGELAALRAGASRLFTLAGAPPAPEASSGPPDAGEGAPPAPAPEGAS